GGIDDPDGGTNAFRCPATDANTPLRNTYAATGLSKVICNVYLRAVSGPSPTSVSLGDASTSKPLTIDYTWKKYSFISTSPSWFSIIFKALGDTVDVYFA